jgi:hypothetical protein
MTQRPNLGEKLRSIRDAQQTLALKAAQARSYAAYEQSKREREVIWNCWYKYVGEVIDQVSKGQYPAPKRVPDEFVQKGCSVDGDLHTHHDIWLAMQIHAQHLGLQVCLRRQHGGADPAVWYEISVEPA